MVIHDLFACSLLKDAKTKNAAKINKNFIFCIFCSSKIFPDKKNAFFISSDKVRLHFFIACNILFLYLRDRFNLIVFSK